MNQILSTRRTFIKTAGLATLGTLAGSSVFPHILRKNEKEKLGVALVGLGYYSTSILAPALQMTQHVELKGIVTGSPDKIPVWQEKYKIEDKNIYNYENMHQVANNPDIDIVYIVLPPALHAQYAIIGANAGKHVWCEKPMEISVEKCQSMIDACNKNKVKLSIGYRLQHEPNTQTIIGYAKKKPYGKIVKLIAEAGYFDGRSGHWKQIKALGGGAMYDMGVYPLNAARYTVGEEPIAVTARHDNARKDIYHEVDETTIFQLEFPSGAIANCKTSLGMSMNTLHVDCAKGWYELIPFQGYSGVKGQTSKGILLNATQPNQQARQMDDDAQAIKNDTAVIAPGEEGLADIRVVEAIYRSAAAGARVTI
ncbi:MAG: Gfo/Idh/MocA family oxidoreductase [Bacteroidia bacterium]